MPPRRRHETFKDKNICEPKGRICKAFLSLWEPVPVIQKYINKELNKLKKSKFIVLNFRGGDKLSTHEAPRYHIENAIQLLAKNLSSHNPIEYACVLIGDDWALANKAIPFIQQQLHCASVINRIPKKYHHEQSSFNALPIEKRCQMMKELLTDIEIIAHADAVVGMSRSNVMKLGINLKRCRFSKQGNVYDWEGIDMYTYACDPFFTPEGDPGQ